MIAQLPPVTDRDNSKRYNKQLREAVGLLIHASRAAHDAIFRQQKLAAKEQAVCDLLIHQHLYSVLLKRHGEKALQRQHLPPAQPSAAQLEAALSVVQQWNHSCTLCESAHQHLLQRQPTTADGGYPPLPEGQACLQCSSTAVAAGPRLLQTLLTDQAQQPATKQDQAGFYPIPDTYVSRLLLSATREQLRQVTFMTERDWQAYFARIMPHLLLLIEMTSRHRAQPASSTGDQPPSTSFYLSDPLLQLQHAQTNQAADTAPSVAVQSTAQLCSNACGCGTLASAPAQTHKPSALAHLGAAAVSAEGSSHGSAQTVLQNLCAAGLPLGTCPVLDVAQLLQAVDSAVQLLLLGLMHNQLPVLQASVCSYSMGRTYTPGASHWQAVTQRLQLTREQEMQLTACMEEYTRLAGSCRQLGAALAPQLDTPSLLLAAEQAQQSRSRSSSLQATQPSSAGTESPETPGIATNQQGRAQQQQQYGRPSTGAKRDRSGRAPAAGKRAQPACSTATAVQDKLCEAVQQVDAQSCSFQELDQKLRQYVQLQHVHLLNLVSFVVNTLSQTQLALAFVGAYPLAPDFIAIAAAASTALAQRQQHKLQQEQQAVLKREALGAEDAAGAEAAAAAAATGAPAAPKCQGRKGRKKAAKCRATSPRPQSQALPVRAEPLQVQAPLLQCVTQRHVQQRSADLQQHQRLCWAELAAMQPLQPCGRPQLVPVQQQQQQQASQEHLPQLPQVQLQQLCPQLAPMQQQESPRAQGPQTLPAISQQQQEQRYTDTLLQHQHGVGDGVEQHSHQHQEQQFTNALLQHQRHIVCIGGFEKHSHQHQEQQYIDALLTHQQPVSCNDGDTQHTRQHQEHGLDVWPLEGSCGGLLGNATAAHQASVMDVDF